MYTASAIFSPAVRDFLAEQLAQTDNYVRANAYIAEVSGIVQFFKQPEDLRTFVNLLQTNTDILCQDSIRREYGDIQTPHELTDWICGYLHAQGRQPEILVEPTFGIGTFILSALRQFSSLQQIYGVEIYAPYYWETRCRVLEWGITHPDAFKPRIHLVCANAFQYPFEAISVSAEPQTILVLGNLPWVTNAELSKMNATNIPEKRNTKALPGLEALLGKSNFDISAAILHKLCAAFSSRPGSLALLLKQAVIQQLVQELPTTAYRLQRLKSLAIDAKKYFHASVSAALFEADFQAAIPEVTCDGRTFASPDRKGQTFGWVRGQFVADRDGYSQVQFVDGCSPYEWRQGVKHDCAKVMELQRVNGAYRNGFHESVNLEPDVVYGLCKSSDLKSLVITTPRKYVLLPQRTLGEDTTPLASKYPHTYWYLNQHRSIFAQRKSSVYKGKPDFSIFGIGPYAFAPYKVAISGLYKRPTFTLIVPEDGRPVMLDDTCYFLGFDTLPDAIMAWALLNGDTVQQFLRAITFVNAKRPYTKQCLMRINLARIASTMDYTNLLRQIQQCDPRFTQYVTRQHWAMFVEQTSSVRRNHFSGLLQTAKAVTMNDTAQ